MSTIQPLQAIETKTLAQTEHNPFRIQGKAQAGRTTVPLNPAEPSTQLETHRKGMEALCKKFNWNPSHFKPGWGFSKSGSTMVWVFVPPTVLIETLVSKIDTNGNRYHAVRISTPQTARDALWYKCDHYKNYPQAFLNCYGGSWDELNAQCFHSHSEVTRKELHSLTSDSPTLSNQEIKSLFHSLARGYENELSTKN